MTDPAVNVKGLRELNRAFAKTDKTTKKRMKEQLRQVAKPLASEAEQRTLGTIGNMTPAWAQTRIGVTQKLVYVAPKQRGGKGNGTNRPNLKPLIMDRSFGPTLDAHRDGIIRDFESMLDEVARTWGA